MTVGIAAAYDLEDSPGDRAVVLVADRMVTTGAVEHEHADGKLEEVSVGNPAVAAVAAGTLSYADELYYRVGNRVIGEGPDTVQEVGHLFVDEIHNIVRDEANNRILSDYSLSLNQLTNEGVPLSDGVVGELMEAVTNLKDEIHNGTNLLLAGVDDEHGAQILELRNGSIVRHRSLGYHCIGSGAGSARLTFMRNGYDPEDLEDALLLAADAKNQAGEAQGVGRKMDVAIVSDRVDELDPAEANEIQDLIEDVRDAEQTARENTINQADIDVPR